MATPHSSDRPSLVLEDLDGQRQSLSQLSGRIVVANFWATWCVPCREEMPILVALQARYARRGVQVIGISTDALDKRNAVARFAAQHELNFPIWVGATTRDMERLGLGQALPATAILDGEGRIVSRILGPVTKRDLCRRIDWLLAAPPSLVDNFSTSGDEHGDHHAHEEGHGDDHEHGGVGMEGASLVPS